MQERVVDLRVFTILLVLAACKVAEEGGDELVSESGNSASAESSTLGESDTDCIPGELACACNGGLCLGDLECENGICTDPNCIPGELACECNMGLCLGDLECMDGVCLPAGGTTSTSESTSDTMSTTSSDSTDGSTSDTTSTSEGSTTTSTTGNQECPAPNEMMCDGACVDVWTNSDHCGTCGVVCGVSNDMSVGGCLDGECQNYWSECFVQADGFTSCEQVCQAEGKACVEDGCGGYTWMQAGNVTCEGGSINGTLHSGVSCGGPIVWQASHARCCCTP